MAFVKFFEKAISLVSIFLLTAGALYLLYLICKQYGWEGVSEMFKKDVWRSAPKFLLIVMIFLVIMGEVSFLARKNPDRVHNILAGKEGQIKRASICMVLPGPAGAKELRTAWNDGVSRKSDVIFCLTVMMAAGITMFLFRAQYLGVELTTIWIAIATALAVVVWIIGHVVDRFA